MRDGVARHPVEIGDRARPALDERFFLHLPRLLRAATRLTFRLPVRSRLRRELIVRNVQLSYEGQNRNDWRFTLSLYDDASELRNVPIRGGGERVAGVGYAYRGVAGARQLAEDWAEPWENMRFEPQEVIDVGDGRLVVLSHMIATGRTSGVQVREPLAQLIEFDRGIVRVQQNWLGRWEDGLEAAGLGSSPPAD